MGLGYARLVGMWSDWESLYWSTNNMPAQAKTGNSADAIADCNNNTRDFEIICCLQCSRTLVNCWPGFCFRHVCDREDDNERNTVRDRYNCEIYHIALLMPVRAPYHPSRALQRDILQGERVSCHHRSHTTDSYTSSMIGACAPLPALRNHCSKDER